jgi:hypothetical protein
MVDIKRLRQHLNILNEELKETQLLLESLNASYQQAMLEHGGNANGILEYIHLAGKQECAIKNRIECIEGAISKFSKAVEDTRLAVSSAEEIIRHLKI